MKRKDLYKKHRDHLRNDNVIVQDRMGQYFESTYKRANMQVSLEENPANQLREASLDQASEELERQQLRYHRMQKQLSTIVVYRQELMEKK